MLISGRLDSASSGNSDGGCEVDNDIAWGVAQGLMGWGDTDNIMGVMSIDTLGVMSLPGNTSSWLNSGGVRPNPGVSGIAWGVARGRMGWGDMDDIMGVVSIDVCTSSAWSSVPLGV
eukprot:PhM_4_TR8385/c0_g1_i2/m.11948